MRDAASKERMMDPAAVDSMRQTNKNIMSSACHVVIDGCVDSPSFIVMM